MAQTYLIPFGSTLKVQDGDVVEAGDELTTGSINPHDILRIKNLLAVQEYLVKEVQKVYKTQGVDISDKHIEVIIRQMMRKLKIEDPGNITFEGVSLLSNYVDRSDYNKIYDEIDLSEHIISGENHFALLVHYFGKDSQRYKKYQAGAIFEVTENGKVILASDEDILSRKSKTYISGICREITGQLGFSYTYDAKNEDLWQVGQGSDLKRSVGVSKKCEFYKRPNKKLVLDEGVAGSIIGTNRFSYDLFGENVNIAWYLKSYVPNGQIAISWSTYKLVAGMFKCSKQEPFIIEGYGSLESYLLESEIV
jgi:hypothetical protein